MPRRLLLRLLGPPAVLAPQPDGSYRPVHIRRTAGTQILIYLAIHRDGADTDELKELLWPDVPNRAATSRLATTLSELRRTLHTAAGAPVLRHTPHPARSGCATYRLTPGQVDVDLWQLHDLLDAAATGDPATAGGADRAVLLRRAANLPAGNLAHGLDLDWLHPHREAVARHVTDLHQHLADITADHQVAIDVLRRAIVFAPHTEALYQALMRRQAASGDHHGVQHTYAALVARLAELHTHPTPATRRLADQLSTANRTAPTQRHHGKQQPASPPGDVPDLADQRRGRR